MVVMMHQVHVFEDSADLVVAQCVCGWWCPADSDAAAMVIGFQHLASVFGGVR